VAELSVIIVNRNGGARLEECLASVEKERAGKDWEVLLVDNASTDGSPDMVTLRFPGVKFVRNVDNLGFARANNQGLRISGGKFVLFLNPDTRVFPGSLELLLEALGRDPGLGAVGPALLLGEKTYQVSFGEKITFFRELARKSVLNAWRQGRLRRLRRRHPVAWVSGACLMTGREILDKVGGFDEKFLLYFEDIDLCYRIREQGLRVVFLPEARVFHAGGASTAAAPFSSRLEYRRSQLYFYEKHSSASSQRLLRFYLRLSVRLGGLFGSKRDEARAFRRDLLDLLHAARTGRR
jgi:GT2 family glycosyltransferase